MSSSRRSRLSAAPASVSPSASPLLFDASHGTVTQLKEWIAAHQSAADERQQREEEEGTGAKRNKAYYERQVRRVQQRMRAQEKSSIDLRSSGEDDDDEGRAELQVDDSKAATPHRRPRPRSLSPATAAFSTGSQKQAASKRRQTATAAELDRRHSEQAGGSVRKRRRSASTESSKNRPTKKSSLGSAQRTASAGRNRPVYDDIEDMPMEAVQGAGMALSPPTHASASRRQSSSSPLSASSAYVDASLLDEPPPHRRSAAPISPRSPANVFQAEQSVSQQRQTRGDGQLSQQSTTVASTHKHAPLGRPSLPPPSPATPAAARASPSSFPFTSPSSALGLRHRLSSFIPSFFNSHSPQSPGTQRAISADSSQRLQREKSSDELRRIQQQEEEAKARLAAVQQQLEQERKAKEEAEKERSRLAEQVQQLEQERKKEAERRTASRVPVNGVAPPMRAAAKASREWPEKDELGAMKAPTGFLSRLSASCRRATSFVLRLLAVMMALLLALMALQTSPARRLLGLQQDTLFCPSTSLPSAVDGVYHGALVRLDGKADCTACPANGWCDEYGHLQCDRTYVRQNNLCVKDGAWMHRALYFKEQAMTLLQDQLGRFECGQAEQRGLTGQQLLESIKFVPWWEQLLKSAPPTSAEKDEALKQFVYAMRLIEQDTQTANVTHKPARDVDVLSTEYVAVSGTHPLLCSVRLTAWQNKGKLLLFAVGWSAAYYLYSLTQRWLWRRRVRPMLRQRVISMLQERAPKAVAIEHVRDELWQGQDSSVWERVMADIEADTRTEPCNTKFGQISRPSWRWMGPLPSGGGSSSGSRERQPSKLAATAFDSMAADVAAQQPAREHIVAADLSLAPSTLAPTNAAFSQYDLSPSAPPAAKRAGSGCVLC